MRPRGLGGRLTLLVAVGATLVIAALTAGFNLVLRSSLENDAERVVRSRASSALETVAVGPAGMPRLIEAPAAQDAGVGIWVFGPDGRTLERPQAPPEVQSLAGSLAGDDDAFSESTAFDTELYALAVRDADGTQVGTVVASLSVEPYERTAKKALIASVGFALLVLLGIVLVSRLLVARALRPVARMTREATDWSEHDLDHRFAAGEPYDEVTLLAAAFDSMLDRLASTLRREQRMSAEISHELRTPLAAIVAEAELALGGPIGEQRGALERIRERSAQLASILETLLLAARAEIDPSRSGCDAVAVVGFAVKDFGRPQLSRGKNVIVGSAPDAAGVGVEADLLARMLAPLLENGCRYGRSRVVVAVDARSQQVDITVADDGPGMTEDERERVFDAGVRGSAASSSEWTDGAGLGLALVRRLAQASGGEVRAVSAAHPGGGGRFVLSLPAIGHL